MIVIDEPVQKVHMCYMCCLSNQTRMNSMSHSFFFCRSYLLKVRVGFGDSLRSIFALRRAPLEVLDEDQREGCMRAKKCTMSHLFGQYMGLILKTSNVLIIRCFQHVSAVTQR